MGGGGSRLALHWMHRRSVISRSIERLPPLGLRYKNNKKKKKKKTVCTDANGLGLFYVSISTSGGAFPIREADAATGSSSMVGLGRLAEYRLDLNTPVPDVVVEAALLRARRFSYR